MINLNFLHDLKSFYTFASSKPKSNGYATKIKLYNRESSVDDVICKMFADCFAST